MGSVSADDPDSADTVTGYSAGGTDGARFTISDDGVISFVVAPDYENPTDADGNNVYEFAVTATSGEGDTAAATDPDPEDNITNYIKGARDANNAVIDDGNLFQLVKQNGRKTGEIEFKQAPEFDNPTDGNTDNVYEFTMTAVSGAGGRKLTTTVD